MTDRAISRQKVLDRIRRGTPAAAANSAQLAEAYAGLPRNYVRHGSMDLQARVEKIVERLREYDAEVTECAPQDLAAAIAARLAESGRHSFVVPAGIPAEWMAEGFEWKKDNDLSAGDIEKADGVMTAAFCGVADSGTIVLHHQAAEGRRILSLLPDWHLCILRASQVVETLPEYFARCEQPPALHPSDEDLSPGTPALVTWVSGPSATADIEMTRIKGVHGPRFLEVVLVHDAETRANLN